MPPDDTGVNLAGDGSNRGITNAWYHFIACEIVV